MPVYHADVMPNEDGEMGAWCPECEGSGCSEQERIDYDTPVNHRGNPDCEDCPVCCGFGRLDW